MPFERLISFTDISFLKTADKSMKFYKRSSKETFLKYSTERINTHLSLQTDIWTIMVHGIDSRFLKLLIMFFAFSVI